MRRLIPVISVALVVLALVIGWRVQHTRTVEAVVSDVITRPAPELGPRTHLLLPNLKDRTVVVPDRPHDGNETRSEDRLAKIGRQRVFSVSTNSIGLRGPELRPKGEAFRIVGYGDSVTFGWGVAYAESWPARLGTLLDMDVVNAGVPAMKPLPLAAWVEQSVQALQPDLVIFAARPYHATPSAWQDYERALNTVVRASRPARVAIVLPPISTFDPLGNQNQASELRHIQEIAGRVAQGPVPVLDLTGAFRKNMPERGVIMNTDGKVQKMVRLPQGVVVAEGVPLHPGALAPALIEAFESDESIAEPLFFDGGHPDAEGFELFAAELEVWLRKRTLIPVR